jgi:plastocyanin
MEEQNPTTESKPEQPSFKVGDAVTWTHTKSNGNRFSFSTRDGKIIELNNVFALVKMRNGQKKNVCLSDLTPAGQPTALTKFFTEL